MITNAQACPTIILSLFESAKPIDEKQVKVKLVDINISQQDEQMFEFKFEIVRGSIVGQFIFDYIHFVPFQSTSWKMPKFLSGMGYVKGPINFNTFLNVETVVDLAVGTSKTDGKIYQNIIYFPYGKYPSTTKEVAPKVLNNNAVGKVLPITAAPLFELPKAEQPKAVAVPVVEQPVVSAPKVTEPQPQPKKPIYTDPATGEVLPYNPNEFDDNDLPF